MQNFRLAVFDGVSVVTGLKEEIGEVEVDVLGKSLVLLLNPLSDRRVVGSKIVVRGWETELWILIAVQTICFLSLFRLFSLVLSS